MPPSCWPLGLALGGAGDRPSASPWAILLTMIMHVCKLEAKGRFTAHRMPMPDHVVVVGVVARSIIGMESS